MIKKLPDTLVPGGALVALVVGGVEIGSTLFSITHRHFTTSTVMWGIKEKTTN